MNPLKKNNGNGFSLIIEAKSRNRQFFRDLWQYRHLYFFLSWRDILVQYKQTVIGIFWSILRPVLTMIVFTLVFGRLAKMPSEGVPYPLLVFSAMIPWQLFAHGLAESSNSLINNANLISKIYFPRIIIPISTLTVSIIDFIISFIILLLMMIGYGHFPDVRILYIFLLLPLTIITALGCGFLFSALNVKYRDFRYIVPFMIQLGLYISPVGYSTTVIPKKYLLFYFLNPMSGIIEGFRWALLQGKTNLNETGILMSVIVSLTLFSIGFIYFKRTENRFADII